MSVPVLLGCLLAVLLLAVPSHAQSMKVAAASIPMPPDDEPQPLQGLAYGGEWSVGFDSIRVQRDHPKGVMWTIAGKSSRPKPQRVKLKLMVLDETGETIAAVNTSVMLKPNSEDQSFDFVMKKVRPEDLERGEQVTIRATFMIGA